MLVLPEPPNARSLVFLRRKGRAAGRLRAETLSTEELGRISLANE